MALVPTHSNEKQMAMAQEINANPQTAPSGAIVCVCVFLPPKQPCAWIGRRAQHGNFIHGPPSVQFRRPWTPSGSFPNQMKKCSVELQEKLVNQNVHVRAYNR